MSGARVCNMCGREMELHDIYADFTLHKQLGYGTEYDGDTLDLHICNECMSELIHKCAVNPIIENEEV